jgi:GNAT superfamily N-acetyltransferase
MPFQAKTTPDPFADPTYNALHTSQSALAEIHGLARKFPADIAPFAAVEENSSQAMRDLLALLAPGDAIWLFHQAPPPTHGLVLEANITCLQMSYPTDAPIPAPELNSPIVPLTCEHADEMVALTDIAFPGFFRQRTCVMGSYYGIRNGDGTLIAMGGERQRMSADDGTEWIEVSGVCTHPEHRGHGYAAMLIQHLLRDHRKLGAVSCLHVSDTNQTAIALYHRLGFETLRSVDVFRVRRAP